MAKFKEKARIFLREHESHLTLQRLRRNQALTATDLQELEKMLLQADDSRARIDEVREQSHGLGLFIRSLMGLDREAAMQAFCEFLRGGTATPDQIRRAGVDPQRRDGRRTAVRVTIHGRECRGSAGGVPAGQGYADRPGTGRHQRKSGCLTRC
jgi:type I site-specific restriction endonuclease